MRPRLSQWIDHLRRRGPGAEAQPADASVQADRERLEGLLREAAARGPATVLNLSNKGIGAAKARALAASPHLANLTELNLAHNGIGAAGVRALAASPYLARLRERDWPTPS